MRPVLVSQAGGSGGNGHSYSPALSGNGRFVAFASDADNLSKADDNDYTNVFVRDLEQGATTLVSRAATGPADDSSSDAAISADGHLIAFASYADNLSADDDANAQNVFVRDLEQGTTVPLVLLADTDGIAGSACCPSISADGRYVAFTSSAAKLSSIDCDFCQDVFVRDVQLGTTTLVSVTDDDAAGGDADSGGASISADGRFVAFSSEADNLSTADDDGLINVFVRDLQDQTTTSLSLNQDNTAPANDDTLAPAISADGRFVAFHSGATNLSPLDTRGIGNVFVRDLQQGTIELASVSPAAKPADGFTCCPSVSADGRFVILDSDANNLSPDDNNRVSNILVRDLEQDRTILATRAGGAPADQNSFYASISGDGRLVAFQSAADNLSALDEVAYDDVFVQDISTQVPLVGASLSFRHSRRSDAWKGRKRAADDCAGGDLVTIFVERKSHDRRIGHDRTDKNGNYSVRDLTDEPGSYYAKAAGRYNRQGTKFCGGARSRKLRLR